jgi:hypothetical protein
VKVLLDECTPKGVKRILSGHFVLTVQKMGWSGLRNGALLRLAESEEFLVVVTCDKNMFHEQEVRGRSLAVVELPCPRIPELITIAEKIRETVQAARPGNYYLISMS